MSLASALISSRDSFLPGQRQDELAVFSELLTKLQTSVNP
jgi:hypothetical protein